VFKGLRMGGHMGDEKVTVQNLEILRVDTERNLVAIKGAVPGPRNGIVLIRKARKAKPVRVPQVETKKGKK
jgi:large subunit ribosomal protein L3